MLGEVDVMSVYAAEVKRRVATGIIIVHTDSGEIWVNKDAKNRPETGRIAGQKTIPFESIKSGETQKETVLGGLAEVFDDPVLPQVSTHIVSMDKQMRVLPEPITFEDEYGSFACPMAVLLYNGLPTVQFEPFDRREAEPFGWMTVDNFLGETNVRNAARVTVTALEEQGIITSKLKAYHHDSLYRRRVIPDGFSVRSFYKQREEKADVGPIPIYERKH